MPSHASISPDKLARLVGTSRAPIIVDVRSDDDFAADPRLIPGARRRDLSALDDRPVDPRLGSVVVVCAQGGKRAQGAAALLRAAGVAAEALEAGMVVYDAFYRWCRDATDETHDWPAHKGKATVR